MTINRPIPPPRHFLDRSRITPYPPKHPKRSDWRRRVTVCIAAMAAHGGALVLATDTMISVADSSLMNLGGKLVTIPGWAILYAGTLGDEDVLERAFIEDMRKQPDNEPETVRVSLERAVRTAIPKYLTDRFLAPYGIDMDTFLRDRSLFTDEMRNELTRQMVDYSDRYDPELLVVGWGDTASSPHPKYPDKGILLSDPTIFSVGRDGVRSHAKMGFCAIGSGAPAAYATLSFYNYNMHASIAQALYCVAHAKFVAEKSAGVGFMTHLWVLKQDGDLFVIEDEDIHKIRLKWRDLHPAYVHHSAENLIHRILKKDYSHTLTNIKERFTGDEPPVEVIDTAVAAAFKKSKRGSKSRKK